MLVSPNNSQDDKTEVELTMTDGSVLYGELFLSPNQQLLDIFNGEAQFFPFEGMDGAISVINKAAVAKITQYNNAMDDEKLVAFG